MIVVVVVEPETTATSVIGPASAVAIVCKEEAIEFSDAIALKFMYKLRVDASDGDEGRGS